MEAHLLPSLLHIVHSYLGADNWYANKPIVLKVNRDTWRCSTGHMLEWLLLHTPEYQAVSDAMPECAPKLVRSWPHDAIDPQWECERITLESLFTHFDVSQFQLIRCVFAMIPFRHEFALVLLYIGNYFIDILMGNVSSELSHLLKSWQLSKIN
jgi:hypothetical protein